MFYLFNGNPSDIGDVQPQAPPTAGDTINTTPDAQGFRNSVSVTVI